MHGEMRYMEKDAAKRKDPRLLFEDVHTLIPVVMNYYSNRARSENPLRGKISRYAWGHDYHEIMLERLETLLGFIRRAAPRARGLCYVDTGPVTEKVWGAQTTLGWMGKHSNLVTRERGSWVFLGVILLNLELDYDRKEEDYCGSCTRCIRACPTGAIVAPYVVDARLCISYLTIELQGSIPRELRPLIGNRIYGCDDCQEACPWNRFAVESREAAFQPHERNLMPELAPLATLAKEEFNARFKGNAIRRARRDGFVRNVVVALGNSRHPEAVRPLSIALGDPSPVVRAHAAWALGHIGTNEARGALERALSTERDAAVLEEISFGGRLLNPQTFSHQEA